MGGGKGKAPGVVFHTYPLNKKKGVRYIIHNVQIVIKKRKEEKERLRGAVTNHGVPWLATTSHHSRPSILGHPTDLIRSFVTYPLAVIQL